MKFVQERIEERQHDFKKGINIDTGIQKRLETTLNLRKNKNQDRLNKRRQNEDSKSTLDPKLDSKTNISKTTSFEKKCVIDPIQIQGIYSNDPLIVLRSIRYFKRLAEKDNHQDIMNTGIIDTVISYLQYFDHPDHQYESAWFFTNMLSGKSEVCVHLIENTPLPSLMIGLIKSNVTRDLKIQALWAIGNIAGEKDKYMDILIQHNIIPDILNLLREYIKLSENQNKLKRISDVDTILWVLSNLSKSSIFTIPTMTEILTSISGIVYMSTDFNILNQITWIIINIFKKLPDEQHYILFSTNVFNPKLMSLLNHDNAAIVLRILRICGNFISGTDQNTKILVDMGIISYLNKLKDVTNTRIRKEVIWIISNLAVKHIQEIFNAGLVDFVLRITPTCSWEIRKECFYVMSNILKGGEIQQVYRLLCSGCLTVMLGDSKLNTTSVSFLLSPDMNIVYETLTILAKILETFPETTRSIGEYGYEDISNLMYHSDEKISTVASKIIDTYYQYK
jgi:hypothetical protein